MGITTSREIERKLHDAVLEVENSSTVGAERVRVDDILFRNEDVSFSI
jgi:hypothetical protein